MAGEYQPQLSPGGSPAYSGASAEEAGAAIGRGLEQAGGVMDNIIHQRKELDRDQEAASAGLQLAQIQTGIDEQSTDARNNSAPDGAGHTQGIAKSLDDQTAAALGNIKDPRIRAHFAESYAQLKSSVVTREYGWEAGTRVNNMADQIDQTGTTLANGTATNPDPTGLETSLNTIHQSIGALQGVPADLREKLTREQSRKIVVAWGNSMQEKDPHTLLSALDQGILSPYLQPEDIKTLRSGGEIEIRRAAAEEKSALATRTAAAREDLSLFKNKIGDGYVPTADEWAQHATLATTYDLKGDQWDLATLKDQADVNQQYRTASPNTLHADINALEAKGDKRTDAENIRLHHLEAFAPGQIQRWNSDPHAAAAAAGDPAPALDLTSSDPAALQKQVQARVTWARSRAAAAGLTNVPYLSNDELKVFSDRIKQGPAGQLDATALLRTTFGGTIATDIVKQIDPSNKDLQLMVGLHPRMAQLYKEGVAALAGKTVQLGADQDDAQALTDTFEKYKPGIPVDMQPSIMSAARNIAAGVAAEFGRSKPTGDELTGAFREAIQRAGGMVGSPTQGSATGGFVQWYGTYAWLPQDMSRDDFQRRMSRADKGAWIKAAGSAPYYMGADGKRTPLSDAMIAHLPQYRLQTVNPGIYNLLGPDGGHVVTKDGKPWQFDIRNLR